MSRPRFLGFLAGAPVFRIDSPEAGARVWRAPKWREVETGVPFRPGLHIEAAGFSLHISALTTEQLDAIDLEALCSTPRLARALRSLGSGSQTSRR